MLGGLLQSTAGTGDMSKILIVDDDLDLAERVRLWLSSQQHFVEVVHDGQQACEQLRLAQYDVIILDWELPNVCGPDICKRYRAEGGTTPILMLTGRNQIEDKELGFDVGADDYLTKPFHLKELSSRVMALLRRAAASAPPAAAQKQLELVTESKFCQLCGGYFSLEADACPADGTVLVTTQVKVDPLVGTTVGDRYVVMAMIAKGGMSVVYQGWHKFLNRLVAIKFLRSRLAEDPTYLRRFQLEAQSASALKHRNIITVLDFGMMGTEPYLVMAFINGSSLHDVVQTRQYVPVEAAIKIFLQVCSGLGHAHEHGIIHRDIKPSNLMIEKSADGTELVKIVDFGVAKLLPESGQTVERLTQTGEFLGTSAYMSPEQCMGKELDARSDVYSFGCVMYETLVGRPPFTGDNVLDTMQKQINAPIEPLSSVRSDLVIPPQLEAIVLKTLEKDPSRRHQSMEEIRRDLETVQRQNATVLT